MIRFFGCIGGTLALVAWASFAAAQEIPSPSPAHFAAQIVMCGEPLSLPLWLDALEKHLAAARNDAFWDNRRRAQVGAAAQLILAQDPVVMALLQSEAERYAVWDEPQLAPSLTPEWLEDIKDRTGMPKVRPRQRKDNPEEWAFLRILDEAVYKAWRLPPEVFQKRAHEHAHVTIRHLLSEPARYRGEIIPVHGTLKRLSKYDFTLHAREEGLRFVYEGWIYGSTPGAPPFQVLFTTLPEGLKESEEMSRQVTFYGYFLKLNRYRAKDNRVHDTPYLVGPTLIVEADQRASPPQRTSMSAQAVITVIAVIVSVLVVMLGIAWFYRRSDRRVYEKLIDLQGRQAMEMLEKDDSSEPSP